ncbi:hypothetical protein FJY90_07690 [Candidatus Gottesmanbacteria bacterium]|nr:hypothetical protein [Candidatus Gottesmanbacteria bacterium]
MTFILSMGILFFTLREIDDNPKVLESDATTLYVKNNRGRVLWTRQMRYNQGQDNLIFKWYQKIVDIDKEETNEIILAGEDEVNLVNKNEIGRVVCLNQFGEEIWKYNLHDTLTSTLEFLPPYYDFRIIDTVSSFGGQNLILLSANNYSSFSSAIFTLDIKTGQRVGETLWHSGHIYGGLVDDINNDNNLEVVFVAINNGYEKTALGLIELSKLNGFSPSSFNYYFK